MTNLGKRDPGPVLGLGWLLALSVGGGVLLFSAIGLLLAWRIKRRPEPYTTATYYGSQLQLQQQQMRQHSSDEDENDGVPPPGRRGTRLLKRGFFASSTSVGYLSSHFSLPRVPSLQSLNLSGNRLSRTFTLDEEAAHGPKVKKTVSETWLRDNWFSRTPTLPDVDAREREGEGARRYGGPEVVEVIEMDRDGDDGKVGKKGGWTEQRIEVVKNQHNGVDTKAGLGVSSDDGSPVWERPEVVLATLHHQTKSAPSSPDEQQYHSPQRQSPKKQPPPQSPQQQEGRRSVTETDLRFILLSTEQRLRDGSQSPTKTPRHSPSKSNHSLGKTPKTPKTPKSYRSVATSAAVHTPKTPRSYLSVGSSGVQTPASARTPGKRTLGYGVSPAGTHSRASSVCSAANSLIEAAKQELENPADGGVTRLERGRSGAQSRQDYNSGDGNNNGNNHSSRSHIRSQSADSHASSSLSTLYSVDDPEEPLMVAETGDPFIEDTEDIEVAQAVRVSVGDGGWGLRQKQRLYGPRPLGTGTRTSTGTIKPVGAGQLRRANTLNTVGPRIDVTAIPAPLRTSSINSGAAGKLQGKGQAQTQAQMQAQRQSWKLNSERLGVMFQHSQPDRNGANDTWSKRQQQQQQQQEQQGLLVTKKEQGDSGEGLTMDLSEISMVTETVHSSDSEPEELDVSEEESEESEEFTTSSEMTPRAGAGRTSAKNTPSKGVDGMADLSSSPLGEEDIINLLTVTTRSPRRNPKYSSLASEITIAPTPPTPRVRDGSPTPSGSQSRKASAESTTSSNYDRASIASSVRIRVNDSAVALVSNERRNSNNMTKRRHAASVGDAIVELRRMNSIVSSTSVASLASTAFARSVSGGSDVIVGGESPSIPTLRGGGFAPTRTNSKVARAAGRNYLSLGGHGKGDRAALKHHSRGGHARSQSALPVRSTMAVDKENKGLGVMTMRLDVPTRGLREAGRAGNATPLLPPIETLDKASEDIIVEDIDAEEKRRKHESAESLGFYDKDGFLMSSPERESIARGGRLRM